MIGQLKCWLGWHKPPKDPNLVLFQWIAPYGPKLMSFACVRIGCYELDEIELY
jgi:hypothetical protein